MGLDNGFVANIPKKDIPSFVKLPLPYDRDDGAIEIAYYRKCWGICNAILNILNKEATDGYTYDVEAEDIPAIIRAIEPFFSKEYWEEEGDSIWTFEEAYPRILLRNTLNLLWLQGYLEEHPSTVCYFYDSY